jgi:hypothetical protein
MAINLVKLQEDLKLMPYDRIAAYANGANPDIVPPYMATLESMRRAKIAKQAQAEQAQAAVGAPTVKDQSLQAGLAALQPQQPQQAQQMPQGMPPQMAQAAPQQMAQAPQTMPQQAPVMAAGGGLMELPLREDMFSRQDYAGGGIVAFNGEEESYVNDPYQYGKYRGPTEFTEEERRAKEDFLEALKYTYGKTLGPLVSFFAEGEPLQKTAAKPTRPEDRKDLPQADYSLEGRNYPAGTRREPPTNRVIDVDGTAEDKGIASLGGAAPSGGAPRGPVNPELAYFRKRYNEAEPDYMEMLRRAGLDKPPETNRELEAVKKQLADYAERSGTFRSKLMALQPGSFSSGVTGRSLAKYEESRQANIDRINMLVAKSEDLNDKAAFEFRKGNFEKAFDIKDKAQKARDDAAKSAGTIGVNLEQIAAQREQTAAGREATAEARRSGNLAQIENARTRALTQATRDISARIKELESLGSLGGGKLPPTTQAELAQLRQQRDLIIDQVNMRFDQMAAQAGGGAGGFKVIGVKPGS